VALGRLLAPLADGDCIVSFCVALQRRCPLSDELMNHESVVRVGAEFSGEDSA
jgi:hypothetical protein